MHDGLYRGKGEFNVGLFPVYTNRSVTNNKNYNTLLRKILITL